MREETLLALSVEVGECDEERREERERDSFSFALKRAKEQRERESHRFLYTDVLIIRSIIRMSGRTAMSCPSIDE